MAKDIDHRLPSLVFSAIQATLSNEFVAALPCLDISSLQLLVESCHLELIHISSTNSFHVVGCNADNFSRLQIHLLATCSKSLYKTLPDQPVSTTALILQQQQQQQPTIQSDSSTNAVDTISHRDISNLNLSTNDASTILKRNLVITRRSTTTLVKTKRKCGRPPKVRLIVSAPVSEQENLVAVKLHAVNRTDIETDRHTLDLHSDAEDVNVVLGPAVNSPIFSNQNEVLAEKGVILLPRRLRTSDLPYEVHRGRTRLARHEYETLAPFRFFCNICSFRTKRISHLRKHVRLHEGANAVPLLQCPSCPYRTTRANHLSMHRRQHRSMTLVRCDRDGCAYRTDNVKLLARHKTHVHVATIQNRTLIHCHIKDCLYSTTKPYLMKRHLAVHRPVICQESQCTGPEPKANNFIGMSASTSGDEIVDRYVCEHCPYETRLRKSFVRHLSIVHNNERPHLCDTCGRSFKSQHALLKHSMVHEAVDNAMAVTFACSTCSKRFRDQGHLLEHSQTHTTIRAFLCEQCGASFKTKAVQQKHIRTIHSNPKSHPCTLCNKRFNTRFALKRHGSVHDESHAECSRIVKK